VGGRRSKCKWPCAVSLPLSAAKRPQKFSPSNPDLAQMTQAQVWKPATASNVCDMHTTVFPDDRGLKKQQSIQNRNKCTSNRSFRSPVIGKVDNKKEQSTSSSSQEIHCLEENIRTLKQVQSILKKVFPGLAMVSTNMCTC
jgi:hypothetical protein